VVTSDNRPRYNATYLAYELRDGFNDSLDYLVQMSHTWAYGTPIRPHLHFFCPNGATGDIRFQVEYSWANVNEDFPAFTTVQSTKTIAAPTPNRHLVHGLGEIDATGKLVSSILRMRVTRLGLDAADTFADLVLAAEFDIHYQVAHNGTLTEFGPD
jgi:hypothetical protein